MIAKPNRLWRSTYRHNRFFDNVGEAIVFEDAKKEQGSKTTSEPKRMSGKTCAIVYWNEPE